MNNMNTIIKNAVDIAQRTQRNYDLSKTIPNNDLDTLIHAATNAPSKQNETHFSLHVYTDKDIIREIYNATKKFTFGHTKHKSDILNPNLGENWMLENRSVHNSQILANAVFVYVDDEGEMRGLTHILAKHNNDNDSIEVYNEQKSYSVGISLGQLILSATLLGYKTGICAAFEENTLKQILKTNKRIRLLVGVGYENIGIDRRLHAETLNKEILEEFRTGDPDEKWRFYSYDKTIKVSFNGNEK